MKKTLLFLIAATAMMMAGCSNDDFGGATQGMTLNATVEQPASRAIMTDPNDGTYKFSFDNGDELNVTNSKVESYYTFTKNGETFTSANAQTTTALADWYAYFPGNTVNLAGQKGDLAGVANYYACAGKTASATTGADGLTIALTPQVAILRIVTVDDNNPTCDINIMTSDGKWVSGLEATKGTTEFTVETSVSKVSLLNKQEPGIYYIAVPAGVQITIYNGTTKLRATKGAGLKAGKYYTVTNVPVTGKAVATINGETKEVEWVQLWAGGPKFATQNVEGTITFPDATKTGDAYVWGKNWRTPTKEEMTFVNAVQDPISGIYAITPLHATCQIAEESGKVGLRYTGIMPGYTNQSIFLPFDGDKNHVSGNYWTSTSEKETCGTSLNFAGQIYENVDFFAMYYFNSEAYTTNNTKHYVRPVLAE